MHNADQDNPAFQQVNAAQGRGMSAVDMGS